MFITLEGGEGAGKSTQARSLAAALGAAGHDVLLTREPGGTAEAEALRSLLLDPARRWRPTSEILLHFAARHEHLDRMIQPALDRGAWVVCDRFADSTMAYQGYGLDGDRAFIAGLTRSLGRQPDLTLVLRVTPAIAARRLAERQQRLDRYEVMEAGFHTRVAAGFLRIAEAEPDRCVVLDGDGGEAEVHAAIMVVVQRRLPA